MLGSNKVDDGRMAGHSCCSAVRKQAGQVAVESAGPDVWQKKEQEERAVFRTGQSWRWFKAFDILTEY